MGTIVSHNISAMNANRVLKMNGRSAQKVTEKLSSGFKINRAADDAAGLAISEKMRTQIRGLSQASANAQAGISVVQTAEGALGEVHDILHRLNEIATQAASDNNTETDREQSKKEVDALVAEINRIHETTQFNTMNLLDGTFKQKKIQVGSLEGQTIEINIGKMDAATLKINALDISDNEKAGKSMTAIQDAIDTVSAQRADLGALQNRFEHTINNLDNVVENTQAAESQIRDTDIAAAMVEYSKNQILQQTNMAMLAQANQANANVLSLIQ